MIDETVNMPPRRRVVQRATDRMYDDLASGKISVRTTEAELSERYGRDPWVDYKRALRAYGYDHGCLVLVDDANGGCYVAMMEHFGRDIAPEEAGAYFTMPLNAYIERTRAEAGATDGVIPLSSRKRRRYSVYRLPFGDYSSDRQPFFDERGEFMWETFR